MTSKVRAAGLMALIAASFAPGCREGGPRSGGAPTKPPPQVAFVTADLSTGVRIASVQISDSGIDVSAELVNTIAAAVRVSTWPSDAEVATTKTITNIPGQLPGGAPRLAYAQIDWLLDAGLDGNAWYAISMPARPGTTPWATPSRSGSTAAHAAQGCRPPIRPSSAQ